MLCPVSQHTECIVLYPEVSYTCMIREIPQAPSQGVPNTPLGPAHPHVQWLNTIDLSVYMVSWLEPAVPMDARGS